MSDNMKIRSFWRLAWEWVKSKLPFCMLVFAILVAAKMAGCTKSSNVDTKPSASPSASPSVTVTPPMPSPSEQLSTVYFSRLNRFGGANGDMSKAIAKMRAYKLIVFPGDVLLTTDAGWQHEDAKRAIRELKGTTKVALYVPLGTAEGAGNTQEDGRIVKRITRDQFKKRVALAKEMGGDYVFIDMFNDDDGVYKVTTDDQVFALKTIHDVGLPAIMNGWLLDELFDPKKNLAAHWKPGDAYMFEDLGSDPSRDEAKLAKWKRLNTFGLLSIGVGFDKHKNARTEAVGRELTWFGWAEWQYGSP